MTLHEPDLHVIGHQVDHPLQCLHVVDVLVACVSAELVVFHVSHKLPDIIVLFISDKAFLSDSCIDPIVAFLSDPVHSLKSLEIGPELLI